MLQILPFLTWLAAITSAVLLAVLWQLDELRRSSIALLLGWFLVAGYCQFFGSTPLVRALGLVFQTILAVSLSFRWKIST